MIEGRILLMTPAGSIGKNEGPLQGPSKESFLSGSACHWLFRPPLRWFSLNSMNP